MTTTNHGDPIWIDLTVTDLERAKAFYGALFGWSFDDTGDEFGNYHIITLGGQDVGGAMQRTPDMAGAPDAFAVYLSTPDASAAAEASTLSGGAVVVPPMPIGDQGTFFGTVDAAGAFVGGWQPGTRPGTQTGAVAGSPIWYELVTRHYDLAAVYYTNVFGHAYSLVSGDAPTRYATNGLGAAATSGLVDAAAWLPVDVNGYWSITFQVDDIHGAVATVVEQGGAVLDGPMDSGYGWVATVTDDQGVAFRIKTQVAAPGADAVADAPAEADDDVTAEPVAEHAAADATTVDATDAVEVAGAESVDEAEANADEAEANADETGVTPDDVEASGQTADEAHDAELDALIEADEAEARGEGDDERTEGDRA